MAEGIRIEVDPQGKFFESLKKAREHSLNLTIPFTSIAKSWFKANRSIFALSGPGQYQDYGGFFPGKPAWKGASITRREYAYLQKAYKFGFIYPMMTTRSADSQLEKSLTDPTDHNSINYIINKNALYLGTRAKSAQFHQSPEPRTKLPFRPVVFLGVEQTAPTAIRNEYSRWLSVINDYLADKLGEAFSG